MAINCFYLKNSEKNCTMHTTSDNIEVMMGNETGKIIEDYFDSFLQRYKKGLEEWMKGHGFVFNSVDLLH